MLDKNKLTAEEESLLNRLNTKNDNPDYQEYTFIKVKEEVLELITQLYNNPAISINDINYDSKPSDQQKP